MHEDKLKQILKKVNAIPDLNSSNVIDKIKDILQKEDAYAVWEQNSFQLNVNFEFSKPYFKISTIKRLSLLELVVSADCDNVLKFLIENAVKNSSDQSSESIINKKNADGKTLLHYAAKSGAIEAAKYLIKEGANVDAKDNYGRTPLSWAAEHGTKEIVQLLIDERANVDAKGGEAQSTPLIFAIKLYRKNIVQLLIDKKAKVDAKDNDGRTPLFWAAGLGHRDIVRLLIEMRADVDAKDNYERTPLFWAAMVSDKEIVQLLIDKEAKVDAKDNDGRTPLFLAAMGGDKEMVQFLLEEGLNPNEKDKDGKTPMDLAQDSSIKRALEKHIPNKLWLAVLTRNPETANKILNNCKNNDNIAEVLSFPLTLFLSKEQVAELSKQDNKDIIKAMQKTQVVEFGTVSATVAIWGAIVVGIAMYFSLPIAAAIIGATALTITALTAGYAIFHAFKEFPSAEMNKPRSTGAGAEARIPG